MKQTDDSTVTLSPHGGVTREVGEVLHDVISLAELQAELFRVDFCEAGKRLVAPVGLLLLAGVVAMGTVPIILFFVAQLLLLAGLPLWLALLAAAALGFVAAVAAAWVAWRMLQTPLRTFDRSRDELKRNIDWLKHTLARQRTADGDGINKGYTSSTGRGQVEIIRIS